MKVYTKRIAEELEKRGHKCVTEANKKLPRYKVFIFEKSPAFINDFKEITRKS